MYPVNLRPMNKMVNKPENPIPELELFFELAITLRV
jgi:hypothetical protein